MAMARFLIAILAFLTVLSPSLSYAQCRRGISCIPGIPCNVCLTENDPDNDNDGPDAPGAPNQPKHDPAHNPNKTCDADFMNQIYAKAYLEAERQNLMGGLLIRKPDSVLEYSCFNQMASFAATKAAPIFTETHDWFETYNPEGRFDQGKQVLIWGEINKIDIDKSAPMVGPHDDIPDMSQVSPVFGQQYPVIMRVFMKDDRVDKSIEEVVLKSLKDYTDPANPRITYKGYLSGNFSHTFIGGTMPLDYPNGGDFYPGSNYNCPLMNQVHQWARCVNFGEDDQFFSFESLANFDPRILPTACIRTADSPIRGGTDTIAISKNAGDQYATFDPDNTIYDDLTKTDGECAPGIPTGVQLEYINKSVSGIGNVLWQDPIIYEDMVCPNPGCSLTKPPNPECK